ncbi:MAG: hypothetical protein HYS59_02285 [Candidatus Vogelbacteria bacterium]|nr:hypothetical protein [Candidatus Vogelbacteria bacterium]
MPKRKRENRYGMTPETRTPTPEELGFPEERLDDDTARTAVQVEERYPPFTIRDRPLSWNAHRRLLEYFHTTMANASNVVPRELWAWLTDKAADAGCQLTEYELAILLWRYEKRGGEGAGNIVNLEDLQKKLLEKNRLEFPDGVIATVDRTPTPEGGPAIIVEAQSLCGYAECSSSDIPLNGWFPVRSLSHGPDPSGLAREVGFCAEHICMIIALTGPRQGVSREKARELADKYNKSVREEADRIVGAMVLR